MTLKSSFPRRATLAAAVVSVLAASSLLSACIPLAIGGAAAQLSLQKRLAQGLSDADLLPKVSDLPEDLQAAEFQKRFGGVDGPGYKKMATEIERRIAALGLYR